MIPKFKEPIVYFDCDDTLVSWKHCGQWKENMIEFMDPNDKSSIWLEAIPDHINAIKAHKIRGHTVIVWSAGGADWAEEVVKRIGMSQYVDAVMSKPTWFYDDIPSSEFMPEINRRFYPSEDIDE